jgi:nicotinamide-nucleotide amidase
MPKPSSSSTKNRACIVCIGDELLIGQVVNTNASWLGEWLTALGLAVETVQVVADDHDAIVTCLNQASRESELVVVTGGLGPTRDDVTKHALQTLTGQALRFEAQVKEQIETLFARYGRTPNAAQDGQAMVLEHCRVLLNEVGTAPGMCMEVNRALVVSLPGVPYEMKWLTEHRLTPILQHTFHLPPILSETLLTNGMGESYIAERLEAWEVGLPPALKLAYLPSATGVRLRLTARFADLEESRKALRNGMQHLETVLADVAFGHGNDTLAGQVGKALREAGKTLATAESCTGGYLAHLITAEAGASDYYKGSVVAYLDEIKSLALGVSEQDLLDHGAVSETVVMSMAEGLQKKFKTDFAIATSGFAGPSGGTPELPVGTVWIAIATSQGVKAKRFQFGEGRQRIIERAAASALHSLLKILKKKA